MPTPGRGDRHITFDELQYFTAIWCHAERHWGTGETSTSESCQELVHRGAVRPGRPEDLVAKPHDGPSVSDASREDLFVHDLSLAWRTLGEGEDGGFCGPRR